MGVPHLQIVRDEKPEEKPDEMPIGTVKPAKKVEDPKKASDSRFSENAVAYHVLRIIDQAHGRIHGFLAFVDAGCDLAFGKGFLPDRSYDAIGKPDGVVDENMMSRTFTRRMEALFAGHPGSCEAHIQLKNSGRAIILGKHSRPVFFAEPKPYKYVLTLNQAKDQKGNEIFTVKWTAEVKGSLYRDQKDGPILDINDIISMAEKALTDQNEDLTTKEIGWVHFESR